MPIVPRRELVAAYAAGNVIVRRACLFEGRKYLPGDDVPPGLKLSRLEDLVNCGKFMLRPASEPAPAPKPAKPVPAKPGKR